MSRGSSKAQKPDARGGRYLMLPHCLLMSEAFRTASPRSLKALLVLCLRHNGFNNGAIGLSMRELAEGMDSQNHAGNARAIGELLARGLVALARDYPKGKRLAREYRLCFVPTNDAPATHDYLQWTSGDAGTRAKPSRAIGKKGKNGVAVSTTEEADIVAVPTTEAKLSAAVSATARNGTDAKPPFLNGYPVEDSTTHIGNHVGSSVPILEGEGKKAGGPRQTPNGSPEHVSAAPPVEELRERVARHLQQCGRGSQGRLAEQAGIPFGTFSKFLNRAGPLSEQARIRLTCTFPRAETAERNRAAPPNG